MSLRFAFGALGGAVGFLLGGPGGARWGYMLGSTIGSVVDPGTIKGPAIGDIAQQTAQEGVPRPIVFGISPPIAGNIIAQSEPEIVKNRTSGKGGPSYVTESVFRTYAVRVCEGPITGYRRIWRNNVLVYDATEEPAITDEENAAFLEKARLFLGEFDQMPSPDLEAVYGVGTTPAHRGTAYLVMADEDLTELRGAIPQWTFQVSNGPTSETLSNDVLMPWVNGETSPMHPDGVFRFRWYDYSTHGTWFSDLSDALAEANSSSALAGRYVNSLLGWTWNVSIASGHQDATMSPIYALDNGERVLLHLHYNPSIPNAYNGNTGKDLSGLVACRRFPHFVAPAPPTPSPYNWWSGLDENGNPESVIQHVPGVWRLLTGSASGPIGITAFESFVNNCTAFPSSGGYFPVAVRSIDAVVEVQRQVQAPVSDTIEWSPVSGPHNVLAVYADVSGVVTQYPLNPCVPVGDPDDTQAFWEAAYNAAVLAGSIPAGYTYGVEYPVEIDHAWAGLVRTIDSRMLLVDIITTMCERAGVESALLDLTDLEGIQTYGITITNQYSVVEAIRSLGQIYGFDISPRDGQLVFVRRGANSVATITESDLVDDDADISEPDRRLDSISIPRVMHMNYHDIAGGLATDKQTSTRAGDWRSIGEASIQSPVVMDADEAAQAVVVNHKVLAENQRGTHKFSLSDKWIGLCVSDPIIVPIGGVNRRLRIEKLEIFDGFQTYECAYDRQSAYTANVEGIPAAPQTPPPTSIVGPTLLVPLDIPLMRDGDDSSGMSYYVAVSGLSAAWGGAVVELSYDGGANYQDARTVVQASIVGEILDALEDHPQEFPDTVHQLTVRIDTPEADLEGTDLAGMLSRVNLAAIGAPEAAAAAPWELINFANVSETTVEGQWVLDYFLRGRKGTDTRRHYAGEKFVLLDRNVLAFAVGSVADIGRTLTFRATSIGASPDTGTVVSILYAGATQTERAAGYVSARRDGADVIVEWQGVGRLGGGASAVHGIYFDQYRVEFNDGVNPAVTVETSDQTVTQNVAGLSSPLTVTVSQLNDLTGEGPEVQVILL